MIILPQQLSTRIVFGMRRFYQNHILPSKNGGDTNEHTNYLAAVCFYTTLFQKDPLEIPWNEEFNVSEEDVEIIHQAE